jgi:hypothetical protein
LCADELARADAGEHGEDARRLVGHLAEAGPTLPEELQEELGFDAKGLRAVRNKLERVGAIIARGIILPTDGGHRHSSELRRWDQAYALSEPRGGLAELVAAGVAAAVVVPEREARRWFSWPVSTQLVDELVDAGRLERPAPEWLAAA